MLKQITYALITFALLVISIYLFFFLKISDLSIQTTMHRSSITLWNLGHLFVFFILYFVFFKFYHLSKKAFIHTLTLTVFSSFAIGGLIELLQQSTAREASWTDLTLDIIGAAFAFTLSSSKEQRWEKLFSFGVYLVVIISFTPLIKTLIDEARARKEFPIITEFNSPYEAGRIHIDAPYKIKDGSLFTSFSANAVSNIGWRFFPSDWRNYHALVLKIKNLEQSAFTISCRVHDRTHERSFAYSDRFNQIITLHPGEQIIRFDLASIHNAPASRKMDLTNIVSVICFSHQLNQKKHVEIKALKLEKT